MADDNLYFEVLSKKIWKEEKLTEFTNARSISWRGMYDICEVHFYTNCWHTQLTL